MNISPECFKQAVGVAINDRKEVCRIISYKIEDKSATITCRSRSGKTSYHEYVQIDENDPSCFVGYGPYGQGYTVAAVANRYLKEIS